VGLVPKREMNAERIIAAVAAANVEDLRGDALAEACVTAADILVEEGVVTDNADGRYRVDACKLTELPTVVTEFVQGMLAANPKRD
jgi:hypothetical protein